MMSLFLFLHALGKKELVSNLEFVCLILVPNWGIAMN